MNIVKFKLLLSVQIKVRSQANKEIMSSTTQGRALGVLKSELSTPGYSWAASPT